MYDNNIVKKTNLKFRQFISPARDQRGQILLFTILVSLVALTVAIAATRRTTVDIRRVETTTTADRAFSAAEAGIEEKLLEIKEGTLVPNSCTDCGLDFGTSNVKQIGVAVEDTLALSDLRPDTSVSVHFVEDVQNPTNPFDGQLQVIWDQGTALVLTLVYLDGTSATDPPPYYVDRLAWRCGTISNNFFTSAGTPVNGKCTRSFVVGSYKRNVADSPILMRVRAMHGNTSLSVAPITGVDLFPSQIVSITSTGQAGDAERTVQARRTHAGLPAVFDFSLFNASTSNRVVVQQLPLGTPGVRWLEVIAGQVHSNYNGPGNDLEMFNQIPLTRHLCSGTIGCIFSTRDTIGGVPTARFHADTAKRWRVTNYNQTINVGRYSYDSLLQRMQGNIDAEGNTFADVATVLQNGGVVRVAATVAPWITEIVLDETAWSLFGDNPVVVFVGSNTGDVNLIIRANNPPYDFGGKNVMFIVSGSVEVRSSVYTVDAAIIADGVITISNNL